MNYHDHTMQELLAILTGQLGGVYIATTDQYTGKIKMIHALEATVIHSTTGSPDLDGATIPANAKIYGDWTALKLTSGEVIAYGTVVAV